MASFQIISSAGVDMGIYEGATAAEALDVMARDAGYEDFDASCEVTGESGEWKLTRDDAGAQSIIRLVK